jgi:hypothetical protein
MDDGGLLFLHPIIGIDNPVELLNSKFKPIDIRTYENQFGENQYGEYEDVYWSHIPGWHRNVLQHSGIWQKADGDLLP